MEKIKKRLPIITSAFIAIILIHSLFVDYTVQFPDYIATEPSDSAMESMKPQVVAENGVLNRISYLESFLVELESRELPVDTEQEDTKENIKRVLVGQKLLLGLSLFYLLLAFSTAVSYAFRAWFHKTLANVFYPVSFVVLAPKVFYQLNLAMQQEIFSYFYFIFLIFTYGISVISYRLILKNKELAEGFQSLQFSSSLEEEGRSPSNTKTGSIFAPVFHVFLLQKHYVTEFSYFIFFLLGILSLFYIFNYKKVGGEPNSSNWKNLTVSFAYLQFRFLRNGFLSLFSTILIVFFVTFLFSLLLFNIDLIQNHLGLFGKATEF
ncbi:LIC_10230 family protein [Leptospira bourretii]|uniref:LIC_10230 family protein n=1 Tax=Leptospira bourretii TaxID=2484962 RepID=UPI0010916E03|nr:hypothetical protein [Leptospira bourretii]TGL27452.1 hypothetical protein EHQ45_17820 [Leptospira bourretii]